MQVCRLFLFTLFLLFAVSSLFAQKNENKGWVFLSHTQKLNSKWDVLFDAQVRSTNQVKFINTLLLRSAINYHLNKKHSVALGYASKNDWEHEDGKAIQYQPEHRIYQQYLFATKAAKIELTARARFEQRFVKEDKVFLFSQRARAFFAAQIPVIANKDFSKGWYVNLQNETFVNVTNRQHVNNDFFDQNRLFSAIGYRWSKKIDTEFGYMWWRQSQADGYLSSNVYQLMITTEL